MDEDDIKTKEFKIDFENSKYEIIFFYNNYTEENIIIQIEKENSELKFKHIQIPYDINKVGENCTCHIEKKEETNEINYFLIFNEDEKYPIHPLNVKYYLTTGQFHSKQDSSPFFSYLEKKKFNSDDILNLIKRDKINLLYSINITGIKIKNGNYFEKMKKDVQYSYDKLSPIILELYYNKYEETQNLKDLKKSESDYYNQILNLNTVVNQKSMNSLKYDLIYLYASPIRESSISYREEIKRILDLLKNKGKKFNCLFECIGFKTFIDTLIKKKTKILHISSHGCLDEDKNKYSLIMENLDESSYKEKDGVKTIGKQQSIDESILDSQLRKVSSKIKNIDLIILSTCFSGGLAKLFLKYGAKNVIYIHEKWKVADLTSVKFTEYFYSKLIDGYSIKESFDKTIRELKSDKGILFANPNSCCCNHAHIKCQNGNKHSDFHKKNKMECNCNYEQNHRHDMNNKVCKLYEKICSSNKKENFQIYENKRNNYRLICCCDISIPHNEIEKIILYTDPKSNQYPFRYIEDGDLNINDNIKFDFNPYKNLAIIGREDIMLNIFEEIKKGRHFFIIYGKPNLRKKDFVESLCVYLFERKIIEDYLLFFRDEMDYDDIKEKIIGRTSKKIIISIRIDQIEQDYNIINTIEKDFINYKNLYFIIILDKSEINDENIKNKFLSFDLKIYANIAEDILKGFFSFFGRLCNDGYIKNLIKVLL